jgi:hypothetical protein
MANRTVYGAPRVDDSNTTGAPPPMRSVCAPVAGVVHAHALNTDHASRGYRYQVASKRATISAAIAPRQFGTRCHGE